MNHLFFQILSNCPNNTKIKEKEDFLMLTFCTPDHESVLLLGVKADGTYVVGTSKTFGTHESQGFLGAYAEAHNFIAKMGLKPEPPQWKH
jgi:hypothetical protein